MSTGTGQSTSQGAGGEPALALDEAVHEALRFGGPSMLGSYRRLVGYVRDTADGQSQPVRIFVKNCNDALLAPYVALVSSERGTSWADVRAAARTARLYLSEEWGIGEALATEVALLVARGVGAYLVDEGRLGPGDAIVLDSQGAALPSLDAGSAGVSRGGPTVYLGFDDKSASKPAGTAPTPAPVAVRQAPPPQRPVAPAQPTTPPSSRRTTLIVAVVSVVAVAAVALVAWTFLRGGTGSASVVGDATGTDAAADTASSSASLDPAVLDQLSVEQLVLSPDEGQQALVLRVTNESSQTINLTAYMNADGSTDSTSAQHDSAPCFAPGDTTILVAYNKGSAVSGFSYRLVAEVPGDGLQPLQGSYSLQESSVTLDQVSLTLTNTGTRTIRLVKARCYAVQPGVSSDDAGFALFGGTIADTTVAPGASTTITFGDAGSGAQWPDLTRTYYLYGFTQ